MFPSLPNSAICFCTSKWKTDKPAANDFRRRDCCNDSTVVVYFYEPVGAFSRA